MNDRKNQIYNELEQLCAQFKHEVVGRRQAWPRSIKDRILELRNEGERPNTISQRTGISAQTIFSWTYLKRPSEQKPEFLPVKIVSNPTVTVKEKSRPEPNKVILKTLTVTVITPSGYRIEGLPVEELDRFLK